MNSYPRQEFHSYFSNGLKPPTGLDMVDPEEFCSVFQQVLMDCITCDPPPEVWIGVTSRWERCLKRCS